MGRNISTFTNQVAETLGQRIRQRRVEMGWSQRELAQNCGISAGYVAQLELEQAHPTDEKICLLSKALKVSTDWLLRGGQSKLWPEVAAWPEREPPQRRVPIMMHPSAAGIPADVGGWDEVTDYVDLHEWILGSAEEQGARLIVPVVGSSMEGAGIFPGDMVIVDTSNTDPPPGTIVLAQVNGENTIKRYEVVQGTTILLPHNHHITPIVITPGTDFRIIGVVVMVLHRI